MSLGVMLDVAIGLALVFLVFSLVASGVYEAIARGLKWRSKALWTALYRLIECPPPSQTSAGNRLVHAGDEGDLRPRGTDATAADLAAGGPPTIETLYAHPLVGGLEQLSAGARTRLDWVASTGVARALLDLIVPDAKGQTTITKIRTELAKPEWEGKPLQRQLLALVTEAGDDVEKLRTKIEGWFDSQMEMLSQAYRKRAKWFMLVIGMGVAVSFNVNAISLTERLYEDKALRDAFVDEAERVVDACDKKEGDELTKCLEAEESNVKDVVQLPFGRAGNVPVSWGTVAGWAMSGFAIMQGGPFWFDLMKRMVGVRKKQD